jgi:hypothetical protein
MNSFFTMTGMLRVSFVPSTARQARSSGRTKIFIRFPYSTLAGQQATVAEIEAEQAVVAANREPIIRFEKKIQASGGKERRNLKRF